MFYWFYSGTSWRRFILIWKRCDQSKFSTTVKLGYNELGYNELPLITNKFFQFFQSQMHIIYINLPGYNEFPVITNKYGRSQAVRYNRVSLYL
jgi:hypothetical protein